MKQKVLCGKRVGRGPSQQRETEWTGKWGEGSRELRLEDMGISVRGGTHTIGLHTSLTPATKVASQPV